jgi:hypothetical protein
MIFKWRDHLVAKELRKLIQPSSFICSCRNKKWEPISIYLSEGIVEFQGPALPDVPRIVSLEASS